MAFIFAYTSTLTGIRIVEEGSIEKCRKLHTNYSEFYQNTLWPLKFHTQLPGTKYKWDQCPSFLQLFNKITFDSFRVSWSCSNVVGYALRSRAALVIMYCITFASTLSRSWNKIIEKYSIKTNILTKNGMYYL